MQLHPERLRVRLPPREQDLYFALLNRGRWVVNTREAMAIASVSHGHARKILHSLHKRRALVRAGRGLYALCPPGGLYEGGEPSIDPFRVLDQLMNALELPYYAAYATAAFLHGGAHEIPFNVDVATPKVRRPILLGPTRIHFRAVPASRMFGAMRLRQAGEYLAVSDIEKTLLDCADRLDLCGGADGLAQIAYELAPGTDAKKLRQYASVYGSKPVVHRLGYVLAQLARKKPSRVPRPLSKVLKPLLGSAVYPLDPAAGDVGELDAHWKVRVNADVLGWMRA